MAWTRGELDLPRLLAPANPTATAPTRIYRTLDIASENIIARGTLRLASLTSSATTATLANPAYAKKMKYAPYRTPTWDGMNGVKLPELMCVRPAPTKITSMTTF